MPILSDLSNILQNRQQKKFLRGERDRGRKIRERAEADLRNFQRQDLQNAADGLSVDTTAADYQSQGVDSTLAATLDNLQQSGAGFGAIGGLLGQQVQARQNITAGLAQQRQNIEKLRAEDAINIRTTQENRDIAELKGLAAERQYGRKTEDSSRSALQSARQQTFDTIENTSVFKGLEGDIQSEIGSESGGLDIGKLIKLGSKLFAG